MSTDAEIEVRQGGPDDAGRLLALFDDAVAWLVERAEGWARDGGLWFAMGRNGCGDGGGVPHVEDAGAIVLGAAFDYVPPADRPELYVQVLLTRASWRGRGVGARLVEHAAGLAREQGAERLRVDCWDGTPDLPAAYERLGFARVGSFDVKGWPGAILVRDV